MKQREFKPPYALPQHVPPHPLPQHIVAPTHETSALKGSEGRAAIPQAMLTVDEFCEAHRICRATVYNLWRDDIGPDRVKVGRRTLITVEAAARWRAQLESKGE